MGSGWGGERGEEEKMRIEIRERKGDEAAKMRER